MAIERQFTMPVLRELFTNHELLYRESFRPPVDKAGGVRKVGIVGGGTAGWLTALALRTQLPWLDVTLIETPSIPIIGVGEATIPSIVAFLHHYLRLNVRSFTRAVQPTWKQGIRFEWGQPGDYVFQAPFDWEVNGVGMLGSMAEKKNVSAFTLQAHLMALGNAPILRTGKNLQSFLPVLAFSYHLNNARFVDYLSKAGAAAKVNRIEAKVVDAVTKTVDGDEDAHISHLVTESGDELAFDLYVDCTGFRSVLLEGKLGATRKSYSDSLFTDAAYAFNAPHRGDLKPYTTARTMKSGWCWTVPMVEDNHHGYVFSSAHCTEDEAAEEVKKIWPEVHNERVIRFDCGRHDRTWIGNVFAVGNSYGFVEPLESTGLMMIQRAVTTLVRSFPISTESQVVRKFVNTSIGHDWDRLRWFLAAHFKFNKRLDSPFWRDAREKVDVSGIQEALDLYAACGPLSLLPRAMRTSLEDQVGFLFFGLHGLDTILLGQGVPHAPLKREPKSVWKKRQQVASEFARRSLPYAKVLAMLEQHPEWLEQMVSQPGGWVAKMAPYL